jgi:predicted CXXCH cytochrome family protein
MDEGDCMNSSRRLAGILVLFVTIGSGFVGADINGSAHDFSTQAWSAGQVCLVCHTPHNGQTSVVPLWNRETTTTAFTLYSSPTFDASVGQPSGASKACLSCHDGTVALDSFGGNSGTTYLTGGTLLSDDLSNDHPISFVFDNILAGSDGGLHNPETTASGLIGTIQQDLLFDNRMECASCHDVHNSYSQPGLLVKSNAGSALCLTCHNK